MNHYYFTQLYKDLEVEGLAYFIHEKNGFVSSANRRVALAEDINLDVQPNISEEQAYQLALDNVRADALQQQTANGELLITSKGFFYTTGSFHLVYQVEIYVDVSQQWKVSIDARTREFVSTARGLCALDYRWIKVVFPKVCEEVEWFYSAMKI